MDTRLVDGEFVPAGAAAISMPASWRWSPAEHVSVAVASLIVTGVLSPWVYESGRLWRVAFMSGAWPASWFVFTLPLVVLVGLCVLSQMLWWHTQARPGVWVRLAGVGVHLAMLLLAVVWLAGVVAPWVGGLW